MKVSALVDRGLELRARIKKDQAELKDIEARLEKLGLAAPHEPLKDEERDGRRWLAHGSALVVPVIFTADKILGQFVDGSKEHQAILGAAGTAEMVRRFFRPVKTFKNTFTDGKQFRKTAAATLGTSAPPFITACLARDKDGLPKSDGTIAWGDAEPLA